MEITHPELDQAIGKLVEFWFGKMSPGLILAGNTGSGKTALCDIAMGWAATRRLQAEMIEEPDLLERVRNEYGGRSELVQRLSRAGLLILDDVGVASFSKKQWYEEIMWRLLNNRHKEGFKTILTTNLMPNEFGERVGIRAKSRLKVVVEAGYYCTMFDVPDYRDLKYKRSVRELVAA